MTQTKTNKTLEQLCKELKISPAVAKKRLEHLQKPLTK
jgi:hypothetical protein